MQQIDFHTHQLKNEGNIQILNVFAQDLVAEKPECFFSAGLHPWHIEKVNSEECLQAIERAATHKNMLAIGECGLDRSIPTGFALQEKCFKEQIEIAGKYSKPLIIHCVRSYFELIELKKETKSDVPWIIHGYFGNLQTTFQLIKNGFYFSVGENLFNVKSKHEILQNIPIGRLFFETDESKSSISTIYDIASQILKVDEEILKETIFNNFNRLFEARNLLLTII